MVAMGGMYGCAVLLSPSVAGSFIYYGSGWNATSIFFAVAVRILTLLAHPAQRSQRFVFLPARTGGRRGQARAVGTRRAG